MEINNEKNMLASSKRRLCNRFNKKCPALCKQNNIRPERTFSGEEVNDYIKKATRRLTQDYDFDTLRAVAKRRQFDQIRDDQRFNEDRMAAIGPELGAAHFIVARRGAVKIKGRDPWIRMDGTGGYALSRFKLDDFYIEGIDASNTNLMYEGLENFEKLQELKFLNLSNCKYIDDFCMSRLQMFGDTLEVLDVSGCQRITESGITCLHHLKNLKVLNIANTPNIKQRRLLALLVEEMLPESIIRGVDFSLDDNESAGEQYELTDSINTNHVIEDLVNNKDLSIKQINQSSEYETQCHNDNDSLHTNNIESDQRHVQMK